MYNMGALYEDVEKFFGDLFAAYSRLICWLPWLFIWVPILICGSFSLGLIKMGHETKLEALYTPERSQASKDKLLLTQLFPSTNETDYYSHQSLGGDLYAEAIITTDRNNDNVLTKSRLGEIFHFYEEISNVSIDHMNTVLSYRDLCATNNGSCVVGGLPLIQYSRNHSCLVSKDHLPDSSMLSIFIESNLCISASAVKLRFNLKSKSLLSEKLALSWEMAFLKKLRNYKASRLCITYSTSQSLEIELKNHVGDDVKFFPVSVIIMIVYATIVSSGGNCVSTKGHVSRAGILATLLGILASFGVLSMLDIAVVDICGVMPYLVLGIGMDNVFKIMSCYGRTDVKAPTIMRVSESFRQSAISVIITSLSTLFSVCIGATSPFLGVKNFCIYCGVALAFCYLNQLTFFAGCLVLHARRVKASRHCVTCLPTKSREDLKHEGKPLFYVWICGGEPPKRATDEYGPWERIPYSFLPRILLSFPCKTVVMLLFGLYIGAAAWGASNLTIGLKLDTIVPKYSYLYKYYKNDEKYYSSQGPIVSFIVKKPVQYSDPKIRFDIHITLDTARFSQYAEQSTLISWLDAYEKYLLNKNRTSVLNTEKDFIHTLQMEFLPLFPQFHSDITFDASRNVILASRFYIKGYRYKSARADGELMNKMREIATNASVPMLSYSPEFIYYEHYVSILKDTLLGVGVAMIGMLFVALMFIPHPVAVTCVIASMVTIVLGMFGFMHFWGLPLSALTKVQIILSVGFCVEFTVQITHAFMTATGKNRNERVETALWKVGVPIFNSALSTILATLMLAFGNSFMFTSFFKSTVILVTLSVLHSLVFLPVILSFVGPRRTSKPRVFIPVSPSSRSLQYGAPATRPNLVHRQCPEKHVSHCEEERQPLNPVSENSTAQSDRTEDCPISPSTKTSDMSDCESSEGMESSGNTPEEIKSGTSPLPPNHCMV